VFSNRLVKKAMALVAVIIVLVIGLRLIGEVSHDRVQQRAFAAESVRQSFAGAQVVAGPVLSRSCMEETTTPAADGKAAPTISRVSHEQRAFPSLVKWTGSIDVEPRRRSLYVVQTYRSRLSAEVQWSDDGNVMSAPRPNARSTVTCGAPVLTVLVTDARGLRAVEVIVDGQKTTLQPGAGIEGASSGFSTVLRGFASVNELPKTLAATVSIDLVGMDALSIVPLAADNHMKLTSAWPHPSFAGAFLPRESEVTEAGFSASWRVSALATSAQNLFPCRQQKLELGSACVQAMAVSLVDPVNPGVLSERAVKYGELFIVLTFVGIALFEVLRRMRVHPVQYLLIGAALAVFFLLLLSVSEHLPFAAAYALAATACAALIAVYAKSVLGGWRGALPLTLGCAALYAVLYVVLQSEQHALLAGSMLLFAILCAVMLATRNVRWAALEAGNE
jgi:inner membrane protein